MLCAIKLNLLIITGRPMHNKLLSPWHRLMSVSCNKERHETAVRSYLFHISRWIAPFICSAFPYYDFVPRSSKTVLRKMVSVTIFPSKCIATQLILFNFSLTILRTFGDKGGKYPGGTQLMRKRGISPRNFLVTQKYQFSFAFYTLVPVSERKNPANVRIEQQCKLRPGLQNPATSFNMFMPKKYLGHNYIYFQAKNITFANI